ncbi:MAG: hypothetical protein LBU09_01915 [Endomicrobium sp.]|jgi:hypothetical protein|nr:hypothetical protein [Endomicrobium sp.]
MFKVFETSERVDAIATQIKNLAELINQDTISPHAMVISYSMSEFNDFHKKLRNLIEDEIKELSAQMEIELKMLR